MSLENIYSNQVKGKKVMTATTSYGSMSPQFERDPAFKKAEESVFSTLSQILNTSDTILPVVPHQVATVTYEQALLELQQMQKTSNQTQ